MEKAWNILVGIALIENTIFMIAQGGIWIFLGVLFGGCWLLLWHWDRRKKRLIEIEHLISLASAHSIDSDAFIRTLRSSGFTVEECLASDQYPA